MSDTRVSCFRNAITCTVVTAGILFTSACSQSRHASEEKYFIIATNTKLGYWQEASKGMESAAAKLGIHAEFAGPETYDPKEEVEVFKRTMGKKPTGILVSVADPELMTSEINAAIAAGVPVITMDSDAPKSKRLFFVGTNNYQAGVMGGKTLAEKLNRKGNVVVFTIPAQENLINRLKGYHDALANTDIKIIETIDDRGDPTVAFDKTTEMIEKKVNVDAFVCMEATACSEVAEALSRKKITGKVIIAMDSQEGTLDWISKGGINATIGQKPYTMAYYGLHLLDEVYHNRPASLDGNWAQDLEAPVPSAVDTGSTLIDQSNLSLIRKPGGAK